MAFEDAGGGPGGDLSGEWKHISSEPTVELVGGTQVQDVQEVVTQAIPSNVIFTLRFVPEANVPTIVNSLRSEFAGYFNALAAIPGVAGVTTYQDLDGSDQIQDVMQLNVVSTSGRSTAPLVETQFGRNLEDMATEVAAARANLDAIEGR